MSSELKYDKRFAGAKAVAVANGANATTGWWDGAIVYSYGLHSSFYCTGHYYENDWMLYVQTTDGLYLEADLNGSKWKFSTDEFIHIGTYSDEAAQELVNKIIENNKIIISNNLLCARFANNLTEQQREQVYQLQKRLQARNSALQAEGLIKRDSIETGYPEGYADLAAWLNKLMNGEAIGVAVSTIAWIVVACVVLTGAGTMAYFAYKRLADESERDLKYSRELTKVLTSKLTPEEYQQLLDETKGFITKARIKQLLSTGGKWIVGGAIIAAGLYFLHKFDII